MVASTRAGPSVRTGVLALALAVFLALLGAAGQAQTLLTLSNPELPAGQRETQLTREDLLKLPQVMIRTSSEFVDGVVAFEGPLARDVISLIGQGTAQKARLTAANDYSVTVDLAEFRRYDVILALEQDGNRLSRRGKGPIWVMYPMDDHAELRDPVYNNRLIWQLVRIELQ